MNGRAGQQLNVGMGDLIRSMALAVADAQFEMDKSAMVVAEMMGGSRLLRDLDTGELVDPSGEPTEQATLVDSRVYFGYDVVDGARIPRRVSMLELGFTPTFYQFVDTVIEVKLAMRVSGREGSGIGGDAPVLTATPVDATYASSYGYDLEGAATFSTKLAAVPPPAALQASLERMLAEEAAAPPQVAAPDERRLVELPRAGLSFGGIGDYVTTPAVAGDRLAAGYTVEAWVRDLFPGERSAHVAGMTAEGATAWRMGTDAGTFSFQVAGTAPLLAQSRFDHTVWHHVVASYAAGEMRLYVDGRLQNVRTVAPVASPSVHLWFGAFRDDTRLRHLRGAIDEVRLWDRALDTSEIKRNAGYRLLGREAGLVGCWELADGVVTFPDRTPSRRTAVARFDPVGMAFDGSSSWGRIDLTGAGLLDPAGLAYTIELWVEPAEGRRLTPKGVAGLVGKQEGLDKDSYGGIWLDPDGYVVHQYRSAGAGENRAGEIAGGPVDSARWSHVAITRAPGPGPAATRLYLDGAMAASGDAWVPADATTHLHQVMLTLGRNLDGQAKQYFGGRLAQLRVWNHARQAEDVARFHRTRVDLASPGLVGIWPLRDPPGPRIEDIGPHGLHGTRGGSGSAA